jgi:hypothetical protein
LALVVVSLGAWSGLGAAAPDTNGETMIVPGGTEAISRLLGNVDTDHDRFTTSLNRVLLRTIRPDQDWKKIEGRAALDDLLLAVVELEGRLSFPLVLEGTSAESAQRLNAVTQILGFVLESPEPPFRVAARDDALAVNRQRCAQALGWNFASIAHRLDAGETVVLQLPHDAVRFPIDLESWRAMTGKPVTASTAFLAMVRDQRLGLVAEGLRRLTRETREALSRDDLAWLYANAPAAFYRYSFAIEVRDGTLKLPGGPETAAVWAAWVGGDPSNWRWFMRQLLVESDSEHAHVWSALYPVPDPVARYYVDNFIAEPWARTRLDPILEAMASVYGKRFFTAARDVGPGFQSLYRAVPLGGSDAHPHVPHGPGLWLDSLADDAVPKDDAALAKSVSKAMRSEIDAAQCLAQCITRADLASKKPFPVQRYLLTGHVLDGFPDLLTAENVFLVNRVAADYPQAIRALQLLQLSRAETVRAYLMAVSRFERGKKVADRVRRFQGGIELLVGMSQAAKVDAGILESALVDWLALFEGSGGDDPERIAVWLGALLHRLPEQPPKSPGRGPLERAWLDAMAMGTDPQAFEWEGLGYEGRRARDRAASMLALLEREDLPSVDDILRSVDELGELRSAVLDLDLERGQAIASRSIEGEAGARIPTEAGDRDRLLRDVLAASQARELSALDRRLNELLRSEAERLDPLLVAPPYLVSLSELDSVLLEGQRFIRRHKVVDSRPTSLYPDPWSAAHIARETEGAGTPYIVGYLGDVPSALIDIVVQSLNPGPTALHVALLPRHALWLEDATGPSWSRVTPEALQLVAALVNVGDSIVERAAAEIRAGERGPARDFAAQRVPLHRLENGTQSGAAAVSVTPSERFSLGMAAVAGDLRGGPAPELIDETRRALVDEALRETPDAWKSLEPVGARTPHLNGRFRPWMGSWLPYEALDRDASTDALVERELIDLRLAIALFLARHRLSPAVGSDLQRYALDRVPAELHPERAEDWETVIAWVDRLEEADLKDGMRRCLEKGLYRVSGY